MAASKERFRIFVSCSVSEKEVAIAVVDALQRLLSDYADIFLSTGMEHLGSEWMGRIRDEIEKSDLFLLLVSAGATSQSYSGFELGLFQASMLESRSEKRALALFSPEVQVPAMLSEVQNARALPEDIERLLTDLWKIVHDRTPSRGSDHRNDLDKVREIIRESSAKISDAFIQRTADETAIDGYVPDELKVKFELPSPTTTELPNDAMISSTNMEIFGLQKTAPSRIGWTWEAYIDHARKDTLNPEWPRELETACIDFATGGLGFFKHTYKSAYTRKTYQPMVYRALLAKTGGPLRKNYTVTIHLIETSGPEVETPKIDDKLVFVVAAFNDESEVIYEGIRAAAESQQLIAKRVKDEIGDYQITERVLEMIRSARLVVCDLSFERPNVYFELGFARGIGKKVITIARKNSIIHFDVKDWTCLFYSDSRQIERDLRSRFQAELGNK